MSKVCPEKYLESVRIAMLRLGEVERLLADAREIPHYSVIRDYEKSDISTLSQVNGVLYGLEELTTCAMLKLEGFRANRIEKEGT